MTRDGFGRQFESFARSAFRVEARDRYDVPAEQDEFAAFRAGKSRHRRAPDADPWLALVASATASGRTVERVRLVTRPLTQYTQYEFTRYPHNIAAGETVGIVELVVVLAYDEQGRFLSVARVEPIDPYLKAKKRAISLSVDFNHNRR